MAHSSHTVTLMALPARFWKWRMQGAALTLADRVAELTRQPDMILATDMLNLPAFLGLTRDRLSEVPVAIYFHENQLTYPCPPGQSRDLTYAMINWLSTVAADRIYFNSMYHLHDWYSELPRLLKHFPDFTHLDRIDGVRSRSSVLPVGCDLQRIDRAAPRKSLAAPVIIWNQRWEYDKDPETFFRVLYMLADEGLDFRVIIAGICDRHSAPEFEAARAALADRVIHFGRAESGCYVELLRQADIVVSTAIHEFFGVSIVEAIYAGCFPVLPHRLVYPEMIPDAYHDTCLYEDFDTLLAQLRWAVTHRSEARSVARRLNAPVARFDWRAIAAQYDRAFTDLVRG